MCRNNKITISSCTPVEEQPLNHVNDALDRGLFKRHIRYYVEPATFSRAVFLSPLYSLPFSFPREHSVRSSAMGVPASTKRPP